MKPYRSILFSLVLLSTPSVLQAAEINTSFEFNNTSGYFALTDTSFSV